MGLFEDLGIQGMPKIELVGIFSSTWTYIIILVVVGFLLLVALVVTLFFMTYKKKVVLFENISGQGYVPVIKTRARVLNIKRGGTDQVLKTLVGGLYLNAYGKKMGKNTFWFAKGEDGFFYNFVLGDLDTKKAMLDIEPINRDIRGFQTFVDMSTMETYGKSSVAAQVIMYTTVFLFLALLVGGMWILIGKMGELTSPLAGSIERSDENAIKLQEQTQKTAQMMEALIRTMGYEFDKIKLNETSQGGLVQANG